MAAVTKVTKTVPTQTASTDGKKVVRKVIRRVVKKPVDSRPAEVQEAIKRAATTVDDRKHAIKKDYLDKDVPLEKANLRLYILSIVVMVIFILITAGLLYAKTRVETHQSEEASQVAEETIEEEAVPEIVVQEIEQDTEEESVAILEPEDITLEILNGSGVAGAAGEVEEEFADLGYIVESIGNADETEENQLYISSDVSEEELEKLLDDVERRLDIEEVSGSLSDLTTTARIILGAN